MIDRSQTEDFPEPAEPYARVAAKLVDALLAMVLAQFVAPLGMLLGLVYLLVADAMQGGQSPGKRLLNLRVISPRSGRPATVRQSVIRNVDLAVLYVLASFPLLGLVLAIVLGLFVIAVELHGIFRDPKGLRMGDLFAETEVVGEAWQRADQPELSPPL